MSDLCPTCGGGIWPGREPTNCSDTFHGERQPDEVDILRTRVAELEAEVAELKNREAHLDTAFRLAGETENAMRAALIMVKREQDAASMGGDITLTPEQVQQIDAALAGKGKR